MKACSCTQEDVYKAKNQLQQVMEGPHTAE